MEKQCLTIDEIVLEWSEWHSWESLKVDARSLGGVRIPNGRSGVYEVRRAGENARLTIGKASNLRMRIRQGLVKGKVPHSAGEAIRASENLGGLEVRWATTDRPAAAEEELHRLYEVGFDRLPKYTHHT